MKNIFVNESYEVLKSLYNDMLKAREEGIRPRSFDKYIEKVMEAYPLSFGEAWRYTENMFWEEVGRRYFLSE